MGLMNDEMIVRMFKSAKNKDKQIEALAKLNNCESEKIVRKLKEKGIDYSLHKEKDQEEIQKDLLIPEYIKAILTEKLDLLDKAIDQKERELSELNNQYSTLSKFIKGEIL